MSGNEGEQPGQPPASAEPAAPADDQRAAAPDARIAELEGEVEQLKDQVLRALAETENVRRRAERERQDAGKYAIARFADPLLNVADSLRQALAVGTALDALKHGVELTERALTAAFEANGIKRFEPLGQAFDPNFHQAVFEVETADQPAGTVVQVLRAGFTLNDRLLRPAMVAVTKGGAAAVAHVDTSA